MSERDINRLLAVWADIYALGRRGALDHDQLSFDPFYGTTPYELAAAHCADAASANAISPPAMLAWLRKSAEIVCERADATMAAIQAYYTERLYTIRGHTSLRKRRIAASLRLDAALPAGMPGIWLSWNSYPDFLDARLAARRNLSEITYEFMTACLVVIAAFGACGVDEVLELTPDSMSEPRPGQFELVIRKGPHEAPDRRVPFPVIGAQAFRALMRLTEPTRSELGGTSLFCVIWSLAREPDHATRTTRFPKNGYLEDFAAAHGLPRLDQGGERKVSGDQFKHGMAEAFVYAVPGSTMEELCVLMGSSYPGDMRKFVAGYLPGRIAMLKAGIDARVRQASASGTLEAAADLLRDREALAEHEALSKMIDQALCRGFTEGVLRIVDGSDVPGGRGGAKLAAEASEVIARLQAHITLGGANNPDAERLPTIAAIRAMYRRYSYMPVPAGHACCLFQAGRDDPATARCLSAKSATRPPWFSGDQPPDTRPDFDHAGILTCLGGSPDTQGSDVVQRGCRHAAAFACNRTVIAGVAERLNIEAPKAPTAAGREEAKLLAANILQALLAAQPLEVQAT